VHIFDWFVLNFFSLFLLIGNFDLIIFGTRVGAPKVCGPCSAEHVRTFLDPALVILRSCRKVTVVAIRVTTDTYTLYRIKGL